ncbi:hypothetical protein X801_04541 [Opisthorchis viverrini]|uniref:Uncharacterized protein n=1 Tax=Opisthorchis viverrini TaxID=6198 RepID=A0A1S8WYR6_OPIVI|nr:hypothetical protein X801_04541 [Opisthorchis viverrini]
MGPQDVGRIPATAMAVIRDTYGVDLAEVSNEMVGTGPFPTPGLVVSLPASNWNKLWNSISRWRRGAWRYRFTTTFTGRSTCAFIISREANLNLRQADIVCPALICLVCDLKSSGIRVSKVNVRHSHITFDHIPNVYYAHSRLNADHESELFILMETFHSNRGIRGYVRHHWNILLIACDLRNMRSWRRKFTQPFDELECINLKFLGLSLNEPSELFSMYNEALLFDSTAQCNRGSYHMWHVVAIDCHGTGRSVYHGLIESHTAES